MTSELKAILDTIDEFLAQSDQDAKSLWNILSALRGPDDCDCHLKDRSTVVIRRAAFPKTADNRDSYAHDVASFGGEEYTLKTVNVDDAGSGHFALHIRSAAEALGLEEGPMPEEEDEDEDEDDN